jgi:RsiW-degrading membrane proteinase PrsW (M82 family)
VIPPLPGAGVAAAYALLVVVPFVYLRLVLGRRPFDGLPRGAVPGFLLLGCGSAALAVALNTAVARVGLAERLPEALAGGLSLGEALFVSFVLAGVVEEGAKLLALRAGAPAAPHHAALVTAGLLVGVGFGLVENAANVLAASLEPVERATLYVALVRSFVLLHPVATALAADGLGRRRFGPARWRGAAWRGFALAVAVHGLWDLVVFWRLEGIWILPSLAFPWLLWWGSRVVSDRVLRLSGRDPARAAARRPPWVGATLVAFGILHADVIAETLIAVSGGVVEGPVTLYGLDLPGLAPEGLAAYNLGLSLAGLAGVVAAGRRRRWGVPLFAASAVTGLLVELIVVGAAAAVGTLRFDPAELSDDLVAVLFGALLLRWQRGAGRPGAPAPAGRRPANAPAPAAAAGSAGLAAAPGR